MKKDLSTLKITILLYMIAIFIPLNYYFIKSSFDDMRSDSNIINSLTFINGTLLLYAKSNEPDKKESLAKEIGSFIVKMEKDVVKAPYNKEYVKLFRLNEILDSIKKEYGEFTMQNVDFQKSLYALINDIGYFSKAVQDMNEYKVQNVSDRLLISLALTMSLVIILVFFIRTYIKLQFLKHSIHDHVTGLYNKKYYENMLNNAILLSKRHNSPLSLVALEITNYEQLKNTLGKKEFDEQLAEFASAFRDFFRHSDTVCRLDNNLFIAIAPDASNNNILKISSRLRTELQSKLSKRALEIEALIGFATRTVDSSSDLLTEARKIIDSRVLSIGGTI